MCPWTLSSCRCPPSFSRTATTFPSRYSTSPRCVCVLCVCVRALLSFSLLLPCLPFLFTSLFLFFLPSPPCPSASRVSVPSAAGHRRRRAAQGGRVERSQAVSDGARARRAAGEPPLVADAPPRHFRAHLWRCVRAMAGRSICVSRIVCVFRSWESTFFRVCVCRLLSSWLFFI